jgi:uncharacterized membrane protein YfcA
LFVAAGWGAAGGTAAGLVSLAADIVSAGYHWPSHGEKRDGIWSRLFVFIVGVLVGASVAAAAHDEMTGAWPAFIMGIGAPTVIRGALSHLEVDERKTPEVAGTGEDHGQG